MITPPAYGTFGEERVSIPTLGIWSDQDIYLGEPQMKMSRAFVDAEWRYEKLEGVGHWIPKDAPTALARLLIQHWRRVKL